MLRRLIICTGLAIMIVTLPVGAAGAKTVSPEKWASKFCSALQTWQKTLKDEEADATAALSGASGDLVALRQRLITFLSNDIAATDDAIDSIKAAGTPSSTNGAKIVNKVTDGFGGASDVFAGSKAKAEALSTTDSATFVTRATEIVSDLEAASDEISTSFTGLDALDKKGELNKAFVKAKACKFLTS
ncbi:MAG: hypothetical protein ABW073_01075 [Acidimicrobiia bacterium]